MSARFSFKQFCAFSYLAISLSGCSGYAAPTPAPPDSPAVVTVIVPVEVTTAPVIDASAPTATPAVPIIIDGGRIQFDANATTWHTQGDLPAGAILRFTLNAARGQQMNLWLNKVNGPELSTPSVLHVSGADGNVLTPEPAAFFSQILPASQDYFIEIRSIVPNDEVYTLSVEIPAAVIDPALGEKYEPLDPSICQIIQDSAAQALGIEFHRDDRAPFLDSIAGEAGQGCHIYAVTDGTRIANPGEAMQVLMTTAGGGWTEQNGYQGAGPTGFITALTRDMALMKMEVGWKPALGITCPADQPISACPLTPEQKVYSVNIEVAQYRANFSLDGHWEDTANNFSLDLYQDWKNIWGKHTVVAQDGAKIDTLDVSISGLLQGEVINLLFRSSFTQSEGRAQITYIDVNTIRWKIISPPDGEFYLPDEAVLVRK